ncbi:Putative alcohol acetyltransferase/N-acetyltransferase [Colletotrichum destructivum]|uniref:Alcohol acetyltransferase/N-acetyltransferase n=1 Tax=Colletotrichum destructivum TaxID=34406 RepID=A0AAX4IN96_9PEZI|nr:Putative alcohol acetyltransferase/N-acetyltransferase [Colletotrichum destructivum]
MGPQAAAVRPCGNMERYSTARHSLGLYRCVSVTGRYAVPPGTDLEVLKTKLRGAVAQVVMEQPFLRVGIANEDKEAACYVHIPRINFAEHIQWLSPSRPEAADAVLCKHLSFQHDQLWLQLDQRPPWRIAVIPIDTAQGSPSEIEVVFSFHHAIGDGTSGSIFLSRLLNALLNPVVISELEADQLELSEPPILPGPQEQLINGRISWPYFLWELWAAFGPSWLKSKPDVIPWKGRAIDFSMPYQTNVQLLRLPAAIATRLLATARAHSLTLTPLLHALVAASLSRHLPASKAQALEPCSAMSLRRFVPATAGLDVDKQFSILVTSTGHPIPKASTAILRESSGQDLEQAIWGVAASVKNDLKSRLATLPHDDITAMLKYVSNFHEFFTKKDHGERGNSWEVSNLGAINGGATEGALWKLNRAVFSQSAMTVGPGFAVNVAGIAGGEVTITLTWNENIVDTALLESLAADLDSWTHRLAGGAPF